MKIQSFVLCTLSVLFASCTSDRDDSWKFTGIVESDVIRAGSQVAGQILHMTVREGNLVTAGDTLAVIDPERIEFQIEQSRATMQEIENQTEAARMQLSAATTTRDNLRTKLQRLSTLEQAQAATRQSVDDLRAQLDASDAQVKAATASIAALQNRRKQVDAALKGIERQHRDAIITAPVSGTVLMTYVDQGEIIGIGGPVCDIANLEKVWARIYIPEQQLGSVSLGQDARIEIDGMPDHSMSGTITWISGKSEFTPKTILTDATRSTLVYAAKVSVDNPNGVLKIGMPVTVRLQPSSGVSTK